MGTGLLRPHRVSTRSAAKSPGTGPVHTKGPKDPTPLMSFSIVATSPGHPPEVASLPVHEMAHTGISVLQRSRPPPLNIHSAALNSSPSTRTTNTFQKPDRRTWMDKTRTPELEETINRATVSYRRRVPGENTNEAAALQSIDQEDRERDRRSPGGQHRRGAEMAKVTQAEGKAKKARKAQKLVVLIRLFRSCRQQAWSINL